MTTSGTILISFYAVVLAVAVAMLVDLLTNLPMRVWISCPNCDGIGVVDRDTSDPRTCGTCQGWGRFEDIDQAHDPAEETTRPTPTRLSRIRHARRSRAALRTKRGVQ